MKEKLLKYVVLPAMFLLPFLLIELFKYIDQHWPWPIELPAVKQQADPFLSKDFLYMPECVCQDIRIIES